MPRKRKNDKPNIQIILTEENAFVLMNACHALARIFNNQLHIPIDDHIALSHPKRSDILVHCRAIESLIGENRVDSFGERKDAAWGLYTMIRHFLSWRNDPDGGPGCCFQEPLGLSGAGIQPTERAPDNRPTNLRMVKELEELIGTNNIKEALKRVKGWKKKALTISKKKLRKMVTIRSKKVSVIS